MAQDYANKSRRNGPAARKNSPKAAPPPKSKLPLLGLVALVVLVALGFGLYQLTGVKPDPAATQQQVQTAPAPKAAPVKKAAAVKPVAKPEVEEKSFTFYQMLPNSKVEPPEVEAYKSTPKSATDYSKYLLQAGSFRNASDADSLRAKLILKGLPNVTTSPVTSSSGSLWYRVRLGPFESRSKLSKAYDTLVRMNLQPLRIKLDS